MIVLIEVQTMLDLITDCFIIGDCYMYCTKTCAQDSKEMILTLFLLSGVIVNTISWVIFMISHNHYCQPLKNMYLYLFRILHWKNKIAK